MQPPVLAYTKAVEHVFIHLSTIAIVQSFLSKVTALISVSQAAVYRLHGLHGLHGLFLATTVTLRTDA